MKMLLPLNIPRCVGHLPGSAIGYRIECSDCKRRTASRAEVVVWTGDEVPAARPCPERLGNADAS
jgi:hypothetical protein